MSAKSRHQKPEDAGGLIDENDNIVVSYVPDFSACVLPYSTWYQSDFLGGVRGMKAAEIGVYSMLLNEMYERGAALDMSEDRLARLCGTTKKTLRQVLELLIEEEKIVRLDAGLWNVKVQKIFVQRRKNSTTNSEAGKNSARKRNKNNDPPERSLSEGPTNVEPSSEVQSIEDNNNSDKSSLLLSARARDDDNDPYSQFLEKHPRSRESPRGEQAWDDAIAEGIDPGDIIAAASRYAEVAKTFDSDKIKFSDNWLVDRQWEKYPGEQQATAEEIATFEDDVDRKWADSIRKQKHATWLVNAVKPEQLARIIEKGLASVDDARACGFDVSEFREAAE